MTEALQVMTTTETRDDAERMARAVLEARLAACVQILPIDSLYWWQGRIETARESLLLIKTRAELYPALETAIRAVHPYDTPEILAVPVAHGHPAYLAWLAQETQQDGR